MWNQALVFFGRVSDEHKGDISAHRSETPAAVMNSSYGQYTIVCGSSGWWMRIFRQDHFWLPPLPSSPLIPRFPGRTTRLRKDRQLVDHCELNLSNTAAFFSPHMQIEPFQTTPTLEILQQSWASPLPLQENYGNANSVNVLIFVRKLPDRVFRGADWILFLIVQIYQSSSRLDWRVSVL